MCPRMHFLDLQGLYAFWTAGLTTDKNVASDTSNWDSGCTVKATKVLLLYFELESI